MEVVDADFLGHNANMHNMLAWIEGGIPLVILIDFYFSMKNEK